METFKNTLCFTLAGLTLMFVISAASSPDTQGGPFYPKTEIVKMGPFACWTEFDRPWKCIKLY